MVLDHEVDLEAIGKIAKIDITDNIVRDMCRNLVDVVTLNMTSCSEVTDLGLAAVGKYWKNLQEVKLTGCERISHAGLRSLALNCRNLRSISFVGYDIDDSGLRIIAANLMDLECIDMTGCQKVTDRGLSEVAHCCRKLKKLKLGGCFKIGESGNWGLSELIHCQGMECIDLSDCIYLGDRGIRVVSKRCPKLKVLHISRCPSLSLGAISKAVAMIPNLVDLAISDTCKEWTSEALENIISCNQHQLLHLDVSYHTNIGMREIEFICRCSKLKDLKLSGCQVGDKEVEVIDKELPALEALELFGCNVTNEIVRLLAPKEGGIGLSYLGLTDCNGVDTELLKNELTSRYIFSSFVSDETFVGYRPLESEMELRKEAHTSYIQRLASTNIQRMVRGLLVRVGIYRAKKNAWHVENGIPKLQAHFRRKQQMIRTRNLINERNAQRSSHKIQLAYLDYRRIRFYKERLQMHRVKKKRVKAALVMQRYYRGYLGKRLASHLRRLDQMRKLKMMKIRAKQEHSSKIIQRIVRGIISRGKVQRMRDDIELKRVISQRKLESSIFIQRVFRGFMWRKYACEIRLKLDKENKRWYRARQIQCAWRVSTANQLYKQLRFFKQVRINEEKVLKLQNIWRSYAASKKCRLLRALRDLEIKEIYSTITIQRLYRGMLGRYKAKQRKLLRMEKLHITKSSIVVQRLYRGFKGRERSFVQSKLSSVEWKAKPIREQIREKDKAIDHYDLMLTETKTLLQSESKTVDDLRRELQSVSKTEKEYVDSAIVSGVLQRCARTLVMELAKSQTRLDHKRKQCDTLTEKLRELRKKRRQLNGSLMHLTSNQIDKLKAERTENILESIKCLKISKTK